MPYRDRATVESWVGEFLTDEDVPTDIAVLDKDFTAGPESGLIVVSLRTASTVTFIQPTVVSANPTWMVTFEARAHSFDLDSRGVAALAQDLTVLARLCEFLQHKTDAVLAER